MKINPDDITEVAIPFMQQTHLEEVAMLNGLYSAFENVRHGEEVADLSMQIEALVKHTHAHFERENEQMIALNFPVYHVHKHAHDEQLKALDAVIAAWRDNGDLTPVMTFLEITTPAWMKQHISTMDFVTANFFVMCENNT